MRKKRPCSKCHAVMCVNTYCTACKTIYARTVYARDSKSRNNGTGFVVTLSDGEGDDGGWGRFVLSPEVQRNGRILFAPHAEEYRSRGRQKVTPFSVPRERDELRFDL